MKILILSYGIIEIDGRLNELYKSLSIIGSTTLISCSLYNNDKTIKIFIKDRKRHLSIKNYITFIIKSIYEALVSKKKYDIILIDNLFASIPGLILRKIMRNTIFIQDVRELYFVEEMKSFGSKFFVFWEKVMMRRSDIIIVANQERMDIMIEKLNIKVPIIVYENIRTLEVKYDEKLLERKYVEHFRSEFNIICTGPFPIDRLTCNLVRSMKQINYDCSLYLVGSGDEKSKKILEDIIKNEDIKNVYMIESVPLNELKYIVKKCQIGIVNYHQSDLNNLYCASGKIFEYINEGLPVVTTENPPLIRFCNDHKCGISDNDFYNGINEIISNYQQYHKNVSLIKSSFSSEKNNKELAKKISEIQSITSW